MLTWQAHEGPVASLAYAPDGALLSVVADGYVKCWEPPGYQERWRYGVGDLASDETDATGIVLRGRTVAVCRPYVGIDLLDLETGGEIARMDFQRLESIAPGIGVETIFALGRRIHPGRPAPRVWELSVPDGRVVAFGREPIAAKRGDFAINRTGTQVIAGGSRFTWPSGVLEGPIAPRASRFELAADGDQLFGIGSRLSVWGFQTGLLRRRLKGHIAQIRGLTASPDRRTIWTAAADATVRQWNAATCACEMCYGLRIGPLCSIAISLDGLVAAAGGANGRIAVWDLG